MAPSRRKGASKAAAAAAACRQWKVGDLVLAKVKGFPAWPAKVSEPEKWGYSSDWKKVFVYFFGTQQIAFCNPVDVEAFTEERKKSLLTKRHGKGADFVRAVQEIIDSYDKWKKQDQVDDCNSCDQVTLTNTGALVDSSSNFDSQGFAENAIATEDLQLKELSYSVERHDSIIEDANETLVEAVYGKEVSAEEPAADVLVKEMPSISTYYSRKRSKGSSAKSSVTQKTETVVKFSTSSRQESDWLQNFVNPGNYIGRSSDEVASKSDLDGCRRRSRRIRKSTDNYSKCDDIYVLSNGSIREGCPEIANAESDSFCLDEGSLIDSVSKFEESDTAQCLRGDLELKFNSENHLHIKALLLKKKRQLNRKRMTDDANEVAAKSFKAAGLEVELKDTDDIQPGIKRDSDRDEDEYLPLSKRARVRMGKFSIEELPDSLQIEEKPMEEDTANLWGNNSSSHCDENQTADGLHSAARIDVEDAPNACAVSTENGAQLWPVKENRSLTCPLDEEASLPPSKRIHRALEAMSANTAEEQCDNASATMDKLNEHCASPREQSPGLPLSDEQSSGLPLNDENNRSDLKIEVSPRANVPVVGISECFTHSDGLASEETIKSALGLDSGSQVVNSAGSQISKVQEDTFVEEMDHGNCSDLNRPLSGKSNFEAAVHSPGNAPPYLDEVTEVIHSRDGGSTENNGFNDSGCDHTEKGASASGNFTTNSVSGADKTVQQSLVNDTENSVSRSHTNQYSQIDRKFESCDAVDGIEDSERPKDTKTIEYSDNLEDDKGALGICSTSSPTDKVDSPYQISAPNTSVSGQKTTVCHMPTLESATHEEGRVELSMTGGPKSLGQSGNIEAKAALSSFEAMLGTLTRTKESIGRATRIAIDCAKFGYATKVIEILMRTLESELNLHRRVDLFFLVDSITQCSRGLKGQVGGIYPSAIQAVLPRLLTAAAPPGSTTQENRRQCLKVLRLWLERRILPESVIRYHIRELDSLGGSSAGLYSHRSLRTERALDDPVREMEGMLVDEYGSNSSFQLPGFRLPSMLKDDDVECDSDGGSFEAVTPERHSESHEENEKTPITEKHRHILEDVDVELEMEDVAPSNEVETDHPYATQLNNVEASQNQIEQNLQYPFALQQSLEAASSLPPVTHPPEHPPLPPPVPCSVSASVIPDQNTDGVCLKGMGGSFRQSANSSEASRSNPSFPISGYSHTGYRDTQMQTHATESSSRPFRTFHAPARNNVQKGATYCKSQLSRPPHVVPSNNCSYIQSDQRVKPWREGPSHYYSNRYHNGHMERGNYYNSHERMKPGPHDNGGGWRRPMPPFSGQRYPDKKIPYELNPYMVPTCESERVPGWGSRDSTRLPGWGSRESTRLPGWGSRPHSNRRNSTSFRSAPENVVLVSDRAPNFWQSR